ncbi:hypothetical protein [Paenibacillus sp. FSL R5-0345]|uniref:hypothetical protein n=1 Tax=Paenibacillus sp. FSL R5-0345 TaxID=1536770 RepID=UPI0012E04BCC|nr:hypothetical protein [Paenibacillus sp. FSL R5-0345]
MSIFTPAVNEDQSIRAEQQTEKGTILMIAKGGEELGHLVVSSTMGQECAQTFQSNYSIIYRQEDQDKVLMELPIYSAIHQLEQVHWKKMLKISITN